jgi:acetyltransferase-like isoleucine patch superfamily enzyme
MAPARAQGGPARGHDPAEGGAFVAGPGLVVEPGCVLGHPYPGADGPARFGEGCLLRTGTVVYADTRFGHRLRTGARAFVREWTVMGDDCLVGTDAVIDGHLEAGDQVVIQTGVYVPTHVVLGHRVFLGPRAVLTNDRYPLRRRASYRSAGPVIEDDATIGANATLLPGVRVGAGAMVAAGAVVTGDVPAWSLAVGVPARIRDLPAELREPNTVRRRA